MTSDTSKTAFFEYYFDAFWTKASELALSGSSTAAILAYFLNFLWFFLTYFWKLLFCISSYEVFSAFHELYCLFALYFFFQYCKILLLNYSVFWAKVTVLLSIFRCLFDFCFSKGTSVAVLAQTYFLPKSITKSTTPSSDVLT